MTKATNVRIEDYGETASGGILRCRKAQKLETVHG